MTPWSITHSGIVLKVKAKPNARHSRIEGVHAGCLRIFVTAPPENNRANEAIIKLLSKSLGMAQSQVRLMQGGKSSIKTFLLEGYSTEAMERKLEELACGRDL